VGAADRIAPAISRLRLSPASFRAARAGPALAALAGTRLTLSLSEAAKVTFRVERLVPGRLVGGRCRAPTSRTRDSRPCTRRLPLRGRIARSLPAGASGLRYRGRLAGRTLRPGRYHLLARARDAAGNLSQQRRAAFLVLR
jgi:hypothetical protein